MDSSDLPPGPGALKVLADGSLVMPDLYDRRYGRESGAPSGREGDARTETERDRGRLAYSSALRRLAGVTQIVSPELTAARMHTRESHTHKVALVARELAQHIVRKAMLGDAGATAAIEASGGLDIAACEAAGLAHDLGHAPFGHAGERALHGQMVTNVSSDSSVRRLAEGFEGNPQSFRIVTRLAGGTSTRPSMDLTNVTLCAILKYPRAFPKEVDDADLRRKPPKYGAYESDWDAFKRAREAIMGDGWETNGRQSLEASIMDLADDIAYAAHDLEDFVSAEMIDLHDVRFQLTDVSESLAGKDDPEILATLATRNPFIETARTLYADHVELFDLSKYLNAVSAISMMVKEVLERSTDNPLHVILRSVLSDKISNYFANLQIGTDDLPSEDAPYLRVQSVDWHEIQVLKTIPRHWLISSPRMGIIQRAQTEAIKSLTSSLIHWLEQSGVDTAALPEGLRLALKAADVNLADPMNELDERHFRAIADYVCGMSDSEALLRANWFNGREIPGMTMVVEAL